MDITHQPSKHHQINQKNQTRRRLCGERVCMMSWRVCLRQQYNNSTNEFTMQPLLWWYFLWMLSLALSELWVVSCELWVVSCELWLWRCGVQGARFGVPHDHHSNTLMTSSWHHHERRKRKKEGRALCTRRLEYSFFLFACAVASSQIRVHAAKSLHVCSFILVV